MSRLRFAMLTTFYPPYNFGGDGIGIQRLCHGLVRRGHEVDVIQDVDAYMLLHQGAEPSPSAEPEGLTVHRLRTKMGALSALLTQQLGRPVVNGRRIRKLLDEGRYDVINFHNVSLVGGPGLLAYGSGVKLYMAHEHWLVCPSHVLWRHGRELCTGKECLRCQISFRRPPQLWRHTGFLSRKLRHVDTVIAMSEFSRRKHAEFGLGRDMEVLPYFLPDPTAEESVPATPAPSAERPYFLFVGRLEKIKGLDDVIPLFDGASGPELLIAGDGVYRPVLESLAAGKPRVRFLGRQDQATLKRLYAQALALIVPSVCFETFGIILIEAFKQRAPVIARRLGPFPEIVEKAQAGDLFETADDLRAAMARFESDPTRRARLGENGFRAYVEHWSESAVVPRYLDIVRRAAERRGDGALCAKLADGRVAP